MTGQKLAFEFPDPRDERIRVLEEALRHIAGLVELWNGNKFGSANFQRQRWQRLGKAAADALAVGPPVMMVYVTEEKP